jgi:MATE family multidrug resistance protein
LIGYWVVGLPVALLLSRLLGLGPAGMWLGLLGGLATTAALLLYRYLRALGYGGESCHCRAGQPLS